MKGSARKHRSKPRAGEPEVDEMPPESHAGASGMELTSTPWGKLLYPYPRYGTAGHQEYQDSNARMLLDGMKHLDGAYLKLKRGAEAALDEDVKVAQEAQHVDSELTAGEVETHLDDRTAAQGQQLTNAGLHMEEVQELIIDAQQRLDSAQSALASALKRLDANKNQRRVIELQNKIDGVAKTMDVLKTLAGTAVSIAFDPDEAVAELTKCVVDLAFDWGEQELNKKYEEEKDEAQNAALDDEQQADENDEASARSDIKAASDSLYRLKGMFQATEHRVEQRGRAAEKSYDRARGGTQLADLRKQADKAQKDGDAAEEAAKDSRTTIAMDYGTVANDLKEVQGVYPGAPELAEAWATMSSISTRAALEQQDLDALAGRYHSEASQLRATLASIDAKIADAGEQYFADKG